MKHISEILPPVMAGIEGRLVVRSTLVITIGQGPLPWSAANQNKAAGNVGRVGNPPCLSNAQRGIARRNL